MPPFQPADPIESSLPPGPRGAALQTLRYFRDPYGYYEKMQARYGDVFTMPTMNGTLVVALTPDGAREILAGGEEDFYAGFGDEAVSPIIGRGSLLLTDGDRHRRDRKLLSPTFHGGRMRSYAGVMAERARAEIDSWRVGEVFELRAAMGRISLEIIIRTVFGVQSEERIAVFAKAMTEAVVEVNPAPIFFKALQREFFGLGPWARFLEKRAAFDHLIYEQIEQARSANAGGEDVLAKLVALRLEDGSPLDDESIRDQLVTLLVAGHETTATTLAWSLYEILRHPEVLRQARGEIADLGVAPSPDAFRALPYLEAVCQETLRCHPVLAEFFRTVRSSYDFMGWRIPAGVTLAGSILMINRDPVVFPDPIAFRPERFLEQRFAPHQFASFGGGHRHCLGSAFAMQEMMIVLGTLLPRVELEIARPRPLRTVRRNGTLAPEAGVPVRLARRLDPSVARAA